MAFSRMENFDTVLFQNRGQLFRSDGSYMNESKTNSANMFRLNVSRIPTNIFAPSTKQDPMKIKHHYKSVIIVQQLPNIYCKDRSKSY